jgi:hypothetical protein
VTMERMGPESLLVLARGAREGELAAYAALEYPCEDLRVVAAGLRERCDEDAGDRSAVAALVLRAHDWLVGRAGRGEGVASPGGEPTPLWTLPVVAPPRPGRGP